MSWKCVCKEKNIDEDLHCKNCARKRPKYFGVKLELGAKEKMNNEQYATWKLIIAYDHLLEMKIFLDRLKEFPSTDFQFAIKEGRNFKKNILDILEEIEALDPNVQFQDKDGIIQSCSSIRSLCCFYLGSLCFDNKDYKTATEYFQSSYEAEPNQESIYNIAMATINLPAESGGGLFKGKKRAAAEEVKREQEIDLLYKTIKFAPFSHTGIKSGRMLFEKYKLTKIDI